MKILTIQNRIGIGDMVIFLPFIEAIAKKFATPVYLLTKESSKAAQILKSNKNIKEIIILERNNNKNGHHDGLTGSLNLIKQLKSYNFDKVFIYKLPRIILSTVVMSIILYLLLGFFGDKFVYNESWKFIYLFIIVMISLLSYFLVSNFSGAFKFKDIKFKQ